MGMKSAEDYLEEILDKITAAFPSIKGQRTKADSSSVVLASDHDDVNVTMDGEKVQIADANGDPVLFSGDVVGAHSSDYNISAAVTLFKPAGANGIILQALTQNIRFTLDGTTPTASVGFQIPSAAWGPTFIPVPGASIKIIQEAATASLQYQWVA